MDFKNPVKAGVIDGWKKPYAGGSFQPLRFPVAVYPASIYPR